MKQYTHARYFENKSHIVVIMFPKPVPTPTDDQRQAKPTNAVLTEVKYYAPSFGRRLRPVDVAEGVSLFQVKYV